MMRLPMSLPMMLTPWRGLELTMLLMLLATRPAPVTLAGTRMSVWPRSDECEAIAAQLHAGLEGKRRPVRLGLAAIATLHAHLSLLVSLCRGFGLCTRGYLLGGARALGLQAKRGGGRKPLRELRESEAVWLLGRQVCVESG